MILHIYIGTWPAKTNSLNPLILALFNPINTCLDDDPWNGAVLLAPFMLIPRMLLLLAPSRE
jgi:hypothetical protein